MATASDIVTGALQFNQYLAAEEPVSSSDMADGITVLNDMMASWSTDGIRLGYRAVSNSGDYITAPPQAILAMKQNLAVELSPLFKASDAPINPALVMLADKSKKRLKGMTVTVGDSQYGCNAPIGSGNDLYGDYTLAYYGDTEDAGYARFEFSGNTTAESLTANTPAAFSGITWTVKGSNNFTTTTAGTAQYQESGIVEVHTTGQLLLRGSGSGFPGVVTVYVARNGDYIEASAVSASIDSATDDRVLSIDFGPVGVTKSDTLKLMVESTTDAVLAVSGYLEFRLCV